MAVPSEQHSTNTAQELESKKMYLMRGFQVNYNHKTRGERMEMN